MFAFGTNSMWFAGKLCGCGESMPCLFFFASSKFDTFALWIFALFSVHTEMSAKSTWTYDTKKKINADYLCWNCDERCDSREKLDHQDSEEVLFEALVRHRSVYWKNVQSLYSAERKNFRRKCAQTEINFSKEKNQLKQ